MAVRRLLLLALLAAGVAPAGTAAAAEPPDWLPRYDFDVTIDVANRVAHAKQRVTWTNRHAQPASQLVFNFYPRYQIPDADFGLLAKTVEILRMPPSEAMDPAGRHGEMIKATLIPPPRPVQPVSADGEGLPPPRPVPPLELKFDYRPENQTTLVVELPGRVDQGHSVTVELEFRVRLQEKQGRWGQWQGVTFLANWFPVLAYYDHNGWQAMPFIPWHQPFFNEAGVFRGHVTLPTDQKLASSSSCQASKDLGNGWQRIDLCPHVGRDYALLCSNRYQEFAGKARLPDNREVTVRVLAFPEHEFYAQEMIKIIGEALPVYSQWFGPYPYDQLTVAEAFFGWNGNECSGLIMIDERVFGAPHLARGYVEYLVSHETSHQWWYNHVGTNGYTETFMDEAFATYFTHRYLNQKNGKNNALFQYPSYLEWLPNVYRENYRLGSMYGTIRRHEVKPTVAPIPEYEHVIGLFSAAYDRGSMVLGMIEERLGEAAFFDFIRTIQKKYAWKVIRVAEFQRELEEYTGRSWDEFFKQWVYGAGMSDWSVQSVDVKPAGDKKSKQVRVELKQGGEIHEQTTVGFEFKGQPGYQLRIPVIPRIGRLTLDDPPATVETTAEGKTTIEVLLPAEPTQVTVDPDQLLVDTEPANNHWKQPVHFRFAPVYTLVEETDLVDDYDKWNVICGPWVYAATYPDPWYTRSTMLGLRAGAYRTQQFVGGVFAAYRTDIRDVAVGADGLWDHWPWPNTQVGFNYEYRLATPIGTEAPNNANRAVLFGRYVFNYGSSLYLPPLHYLEAYTTYQDNLLPIARSNPPGSVRPENLTQAGLHYRINYLTPYWDPEGGFRFDAQYSGGVSDLGSQVGTHLFQADFHIAKKLPDEYGWLSRAKFAARAYAAAALPDRGEYWALGGGTLFRGFDLAERQGSALWVANLEARWPIYRRCNWDVCDHLLGVRNLNLATFYDVGEVYANGRSVGGVAHAVGAGIRADVHFFSFIERLMFRLDVAQTLNADSPVQFWMGFQQPF